MKYNTFNMRSWLTILQFFVQKKNCGQWWRGNHTLESSLNQKNYIQRKDQMIWETDYWFCGKCLSQKLASKKRILVQTIYFDILQRW